MMLDPVAGEDLLPPVVHKGDRTGDDDGALRQRSRSRSLSGMSRWSAITRELFAGHFETLVKRLFTSVLPPALDADDLMNAAGARGTEIRLKERLTARMATLAAARLDLAPRLTILPPNSGLAIPRGLPLARPTRRLVKDAPSWPRLCSRSSCFDRRHRLFL